MALSKRPTYDRGAQTFVTPTSLFEDEESSESSKGVSVVIEQILGLHGAANTTYASVIADDQMFAEDIGYYQEKMREAEKFSPNVGTLKEINFSDEGGFEKGAQLPAGVTSCVTKTQCSCRSLLYSRML